MGKNKNKKPITIYSIMALVVLLLGGSLTIIGSFLHIDNWVNSGTEYKLGVLEQRYMPAGNHAIFFQSHKVLPADRGSILILISDPQGEHVLARTLEINPDETYGPRPFLATSDILGRLLWQFTAETEGWYTFKADNYHAEQDPEYDRIVIGKYPPSFQLLRKQNDQIRIAGASLTGTCFIGLYILHGVRLHKRARQVKTERSFVDYTPKL